MLYTRVSTEKQSERYGIASQMTALQKRAEDNGWVVLPDGLSLTDDGYSGESLDRPAMNKLREMLRQGAVQARLEANLRWARRNTRHLYLLSGLLHCGLCGGKVGGHVVRVVRYYRCYHTLGDKAPLGTK